MGTQEQSPRVIELNVPGRPHRGTVAHPGGQARVVEACMRYPIVTGVFGRGSGKTPIALFVFLQEAPTIQNMVYEFSYCAPTQRLARIQYRAWKLAFRDALDTSRGLQNGCSDQEMILHVLPMGENKGADVQFWGLEEYDNLRGPRRHRIVVDECKDVHPEAVYSVLLPMLLGRSGRILFIGTPSRSGAGAAWFKAEYLKGCDPEEPDHLSLHAPSMCNPWLKPEEFRMLASACADEKAYQEEILAEFLDDEGAVFENLSNVFRLPHRKVGGNLWIAGPRDRGTDWEGDEPGREPDRYVMGVDFGRVAGGDPTVASVFNARTRDQVALMKLPGMTYAVQLLYIHALKEKYRGATVYFDATGGHGITIADEMALRFGDGAIGVTWTQQRKEADISRGRFLCSRAGNMDLKGPGWHLMNVPWQRRQFEVYQMITTSKGGDKLKNPKYGAPHGEHDDAVAASLLCSEALMFDDTPRFKPEPEANMFTLRWFKEHLEGRRHQQNVQRWFSDRV